MRIAARLAVVVLGVAGLAAVAAAQSPEVRVRMSASPTRVRVGELVSLEIRADVTGASIQGVELPDLDGFEVVARHVSQPLHFQFGGGRPSYRATVVHQLQLRALRPGTFALDRATVTVAGERHASNALTLDVTGTAAIDPTSGKPPVVGASPPPIDPDAPQVDGAVFDPDVFLRTVVDKSRPTVGEQVTVTVYLYTTIGGQPQLTREPTTEGFWVHDLLGPVHSPRPERQIVHGIPFRVYVLRRVAAFPLRSGELRIGAPELRLEQTSVFGMMRGGGAVVERRGVPLTIDVAPLPDPVPAGGAVVGNYEMEASVDRSSANVGDAITLVVKVRGTGNLNDVRVPLPALPGLRVLEPEVHDEISSDADLVGGERTIRYLLIVEAPGQVTIPALRLAYYDPTARRYGRTDTAPIPLTLTGTAVAAPSAGTDEAATGADAADRGRDGAERPLELAPVHPRSDLRRARPPVSAAPWYRWALAAPPLLWIGVLLGGALLARLRRRGATASADGHVRAARKRLRAAHALEAEGDARRFYAEVAGALSQALESQLDGPASGLTHGELRRALDARGVPDDLGRRIIEELESCDFARFSAAGSSKDEMERCRQRVEAILDRLQAQRPVAAREVPT